MQLIFLKISFFGFLTQIFTLIGFNRLLNVIFLLPLLIYFLFQKWKFNLDRKLLIYFLIILLGSFLFAKSWADVYILLIKLLVSSIVGIVAYQTGKEKRFINIFFIGLAVLIFIDFFYRVTCYGYPTINDLLIGNFLYKSSCTISFHDSNASGIIIVFLLSIFHLLYIFKRLSKNMLFVLLFLVLFFTAYTASKASFFCAIAYIPLLIFERFFKDNRIRILMSMPVIIFFGYLSFAEGGLDTSLDSKIFYLNILFNTLLSDPMSVLFGHGYFTGSLLLAGDSEFSHILPSLMIGTFGLIGSIGYLGFLFWAYSTNWKTFIPLILFTLLGISYLPPLFDYFIFMIMFLKA